VKFLCNTEFIHSGYRSYFAGTVYSDITADAAQKLIDLDKKKPLGALSFFTPVDEEAAGFMKTVGGQAGKAESAAGAGGPPKQPTRVELIAEAKNLGIKGADRMTVDELKEAIAAKKAETQPDGQAATETPPSPPAGSTGEDGGNVQ
jgi:hypothetical protein